MARIEPLRALRYQPAVAGPLRDLVAPPYDVIGPEQRADLAARSPYNVVHVDLPEGDDPYAHAAAELGRWREAGAVVHDPEPTLWALTQEYAAPDGRRLVRQGFLCRVRIEDYGAGRIRPHERTHPGPREDRLRLTRATRANLSPIFSLYSDPAGAARRALARHTGEPPWGEVLDGEGTLHRVWRVADAEAIAAVQEAAAHAELLIADGHHRYETARVYAEEMGGEGPHRYVLMCLVALEDPGLTVFPTHRLISGTTPEQQEALASAIRRDWEIEPVSEDELVPSGHGDRVQIGYIDAHFEQPFLLTLREQAIADAALPDRPEPYRRLDTAVLEALILKGALGRTDEDIDHLDGLGYARGAEEARAHVADGTYDAAFFMAPTPVARIQAVAAAGANMPPKSTYFFPKLLTGLVFNPLDEARAT